MKIQCPFEQELLDAVASKRWPGRVEQPLAAHVAQCSICRDTVEIAQAFLDESHDSRAEPPLPSASAIWWRAQVRAREEAARLASRPIALVQAIATVCVAAASLAAAPAASAWVRKMIAAVGTTAWWSGPADGNLSWMLGTALYMTLPLLAVGMWVILAPVVVYLALDE
jgi:hypothetical protein